MNLVLITLPRIKDQETYFTVKQNKTTGPHRANYLARFNNLYLFINHCWQQII